MSAVPSCSLPRKRCFDPVIDEGTRLLVLGSLPGEQSLALGQYYGNRQNCFWMLMSDVLGEDLVGLDYPTRLATLLQHGIGLWDVIAEAKRDGSLDSNIRARHDNDLLGLLGRFPHVRSLAFNGETARKVGTRMLGDGASRYALYPLPSSSPAYTLAYKMKVVRWMDLRAQLDLSE